LFFKKINRITNLLFVCIVVNHANSHSYMENPRAKAGLGW
jgi:hypothetical protein